jgi:hypothetical protein
VNDLVTLLGGAAGATLLKSVVDVVLKRMAKAETRSTDQANAAHQGAETQDTLMSTWVRTVLEPVERRAVRAEAAELAARAEAEAATREAREAARRYDVLEDAVREHEPWDRKASRALLAQGVDIEDPPPLRDTP